MRSDTLHLRPDLAEVARLNTWLAEVLGQADPGLAADMKLCLNEAMANSVTHGFAGETDGDIRVTLTVTPTDLTATYADTAPPFDPLSAPKADPLTDLASAEIGGFGIKLMRDSASDLGYRYADGWNLLTIICRLGES